MSYFIVLSIIIINAISLTILLKKRIEEMIPVSVVGIILIIYLTGLFDNIFLGVKVIKIITILQFLAILLFILKQKNSYAVKKILLDIFTPGLLVYIILACISVKINKNRIFEDYDEFNHWALIIKNMFNYNSFGTNEESIVKFNEYPPFSASFQYLFLAIQKVYREDTIIVAQNILYFSFVIPLMKSITWVKNKKKIIPVIFSIIFVPMIFYKNFFVNILVDGFLGIAFSYVFFCMFQEDENIKIRALKILATEIALCLTKTTGIFLAIISLIVMLIRIMMLRKKDNSRFTKEFKLLLGIILVLGVLIFSWYFKVNDNHQRWEFENLLVMNNSEETNIIIQRFISNIFKGNEITERGFSVFSIILVFIAYYTIINKKINTNGFKFYTISMFSVIFVYLIGVLITYITLFDMFESMALASFSRYVSIILLSFVMFQVYILIEKSCKCFECIFVVISFIILFIPITNIQTQYIDGKNYINRSNAIRSDYTKIKEYKEHFKYDDKIIYIAGPKVLIDYLISMNNYELMPITIEKMIPGIFSTEEIFISTIENYDYVYIYQIRNEDQSVIKDVFEEKYIFKNTLYKVKKIEEKITLERVIK